MYVVTIHDSSVYHFVYVQRQRQSIYARPIQGAARTHKLEVVAFLTRRTAASPALELTITTAQTDYFVTPAEFPSLLSGHEIAAGPPGFRL